MHFLTTTVEMMYPLSTLPSLRGELKPIWVGIASEFCILYSLVSMLRMKAFVIRFLQS